MTDVFPGATLRQLVEFGYPQGSLRPVPPAGKAFSVVHITGNSRLPSAQSEIAWRINDPANQNSASFFVNRDGSIYQALGDPLRMDPWSNGDVKAPDTSNPRIAAVVRDGVNANERTLVAIENVGYEPGSPITAAQEAACTRIIAYYHAKAGVPVNRETVIGHYQLNSVTRPNCPGVDKRLLDRIVALAATPAPPQEEPDVNIANLKHQIPKIVRIKPGVTLLNSAGGVHHVLGSDGKDLDGMDAELFGELDGRWVGRRAGADGAFLFDDAAIDRDVPFRLATYGADTDCSDEIATAEAAVTAHVNQEWRDWLATAPAAAGDPS